MNIKDVILDNTKDILPAFKKEYYSSIYKKTEKIVSAVFVVTDIQGSPEDIKDVVTDIRRISRESLSHIVDLMSFGTSRFEDAVRRLLMVKSLLYVLSALRAVRGELVDIIAREIDGVIANLLLVQRERSLDVVHETGELHPAYVEVLTSRRKQPVVVTGTAPTATRGRTQEAGGSETSSTGRRGLILEIVRARGVVSIKDISDNITDCSEKTIQRDLIDMIKDNLLKKEGERRWSKYSLV